MVSDHTFSRRFLFGTGAESISVALSFLTTEYERDYRYQHPPATAISVMKPANAYGKSGKEDRDGIEGGDQLVSAQKTIEKTEDYGYQDVYQKKHPEFFSARSAFKDSIFPQDFKIPECRFWSI